MDLLNDQLNTILSRQLDACTLRQRVIADNIANVNTPGFKKSTVNFQQQLRAALGTGAGEMKASHPRHINATSSQNLAPQVVQVKGTSTRSSGNNVDVDEEMVNLAANTILYQLATRVKSDRSNLMSYVIKGGQ